MKHTVRIHKKGKIKELSADKGTNLLKFLRKHTGEVPAPCAGKGTCGKCRVKADGVLEVPGSKEKKLLGKNWLSKGYRLACYNEINSDMDIFLDGQEEKARILTDAKTRKTKKEPAVRKEFITLAAPGIHDQRSDLERVLKASGSNTLASLESLRFLSDALRKENFKATLVYIDEKLTAVEPGDTTGKNFGLAVDIGTTTIAAYLIDLNTGKQADVHSVLNPQRQFGSDVISRINHTMEQESGLNELHGALIDCINKIIVHFEASAKINKEDIYSVTFAGNTIMLHLLMKLPSRNLAVSPFIPVTTGLHKYAPGDLNIGINPCGQVFVMPSVSAYIGADTVAAVLSSGLYSDDRTTLLIDLGTNGEIVLGNKKWMYACSTAAGPAFEGANIRNGIGGIEGAIDKVAFKPVFGFGTIGGKKAIGICGSGIVDAIAGMLSEDIIDATGRIKEQSDSENLSKEITERLVKVDGHNAFLLHMPKSKKDVEIAITQKDVRELQNAKAAVAAGIRILVKEAGLNLSDIDRVLIAGGFGTFLDIRSALQIGLIPGELKDKIESIGNAAGAGAVECLVSHKRLKKAVQIKERIKYIELSAKPEFMDEYIECMGFDS